MRLGRKAHDAAAVAALPPHRFGAVLPPPVLDRSTVNFRPNLYRNDVLPDCTAAGLANHARGVAALNGYDLVVDPGLVPPFYAACVGVTDNDVDMMGTDGVQMLTVLQRMGTHMFYIGPQALVGRFAPVALNRIALANAMNRLGPLYLGVTLHERDMDTFGSTWAVQQGQDAGAVVGGHCIIGWDYTGLGDADTVRLGTWGAWQQATWMWLEARLDEAYAGVWRQLVRADGSFYSGLTADDLVAEL